MLNALVAGTRDPEVLAELAKGQLRKKLPPLQEALTGRFGVRHIVVVSEILAHLDYLNETIERLSGAIDEAIAPFADARDRLATIPGVNTRLAEAIIGEIGVDMTRFPTTSHLASWAGMCPGHHELAGKSRKGTARRADNWLQRHLTLAARPPRERISRRNITGLRCAGASAAPAKPSGIRSWWRPGTSSPPLASPTRTSDLTGSTAATTPSAAPVARWPN